MVVVVQVQQRGNPLPKARVRGAMMVIMIISVAVVMIVLVSLPRRAVLVRPSVSHQPARMGTCVLLLMLVIAFLHG